MATTYRSLMKRRYEDRLVETIECFDCGSPRGRRCIYRNRECVTCCQAREDFGRPILEAEARFRLMLVEVGVLDREELWPEWARS